METIIYYFSATGNSLAFARRLATGLGDTELVAIPTAFGQPIDDMATRIGFVFPVYAWGLPRIVADFVKGLTFQKDQYIFAVATAGGTFNRTLLELNTLLRSKGARLNAGFAVEESSHALLNVESPLIKFVQSISGKMPGTSEERYEEILTLIQRKETQRIERGSWAGNLFSGLLHPVALGHFKTADHDFAVNANCNQCHTCVRVCPRQNISFENNQPTWHQNCELCFGCIQWCPQAAIQFQQMATANRSHHPEVSIQDVLLR